MSVNKMPVVAIGSTEGVGAMTGYFSDGAVPVVGMMYGLSCFAIEEANGKTMAKFNLVPMRGVSELSPVIYRYLRRRDPNAVVGSPHNLGGVTFAFQINYTTKKVSVGAAVCDEDWNFNKAQGRDFALANLSRAPFEFDYDPDMSLVSGAIAKVYDDKGLRSKNQKLAKAIKDITRDWLESV